VLGKALTLHRLALLLVIHAGQGNQYTSLACRERIKQAGALTSYARLCNPPDNT
jgi:putative transposase